MIRALGVLVRSEKVRALCIAGVNSNHDPGFKLAGIMTEKIVGMLGAKGGRGKT
jgi:hypothetical protein